MNTAYICKPDSDDKLTEYKQIGVREKYGKVLYNRAIRAGYAPIDLDIRIANQFSLEEKIEVLKKCDCVIFGTALGMTKNMSIIIAEAQKNGIPIIKW